MRWAVIKRDMNQKDESIHSNRLDHDDLKNLVKSTNIKSLIERQKLIQIEAVMPRNECGCAAMEWNDEYLNNLTHVELWATYQMYK